MSARATVRLLLDEGEHSQEPGNSNWEDKASSRKSRRTLKLVTFIILICLTMALLNAAVIYALFIANVLHAQPCDSQTEIEEKAEPILNELITKECGELYPWRNIRLPTDVVPVYYNLRIQPNISNLNLEGNVRIALKVLKPTRLIVLHANQLNMISYEIRINSSTLNDTKYSICKRLEQWAFQINRRASVDDRVELFIRYTGLIHYDLSGLYQNRHILENGSQIVSVVTQFESTYARKMLPCFDEPSFKATFNVSVVHEPSHIVRANMHLLKSETLENGLVLDYFAPSVKMSTYLLALAVLNNFSLVRDVTNLTASPIEVNLFAPASVIMNQTDFGLATGISALEFFESYFGIPYPLKKQDMIALDDFAEGAMENWGMITFRDAMLLYNPQRSITKSKENVALVVCHEYAHQWFGNLVTMKWWNDLWLNEGFANYMEYICVENIYPEWKVMDSFYLENFVTSMMLDGFDTSHAISTAVDDPAQIGSIFDAISYQKGASIIGMIMGLAGKENFKIALREYLQTYAYSNADGSDLWRIIGEHASLEKANISVIGVADAWTTQVGYPVVTVSVDEDDNTIILHNQTRFMFLEESRQKSKQMQWPIPIQYKTDYSEESHLTWMKPNDINIKIEVPVKPRWVIANAHSLGYFRVLYDQSIYKEFTLQLQEDHTMIQAVDRAALINDAFSFAKAGFINISTAMNLLLYLEKGEEMDRIQWNIIINHLKMIENNIYETDFIHLFQEFMRAVLSPIYKNVGWTSKENVAERLLQTEILSLACRLQVEDCNSQAKLRFHEWMDDKDSVPVDIQPMVIEEGIRQGTDVEWNQLFNEYLKSKNPSEKLMLLAGLSSTKDIRLINRFLNMCMNTSIIRPNSMSKAFGFLMQNPLAQLHAWRFFRMNFEKINKLIGSTTTILGSTVKSLIEIFNTDYDLNEIQAFFSNKKLGSSQSKVNQAIDSIRVNIQWKKLNEKNLYIWLQEWRSTHK